MYGVFCFFLFCSISYAPWRGGSWCLSGLILLLRLFLAFSLKLIYTTVPYSDLFSCWSV